MLNAYSMNMSWSGARPDRVANSFVEFIAILYKKIGAKTADYASITIKGERASTLGAIHLALRDVDWNSGNTTYNSIELSRLAKLAGWVRPLQSSLPGAVWSNFDRVLNKAVEQYVDAGSVSFDRERQIIVLDRVGAGLFMSFFVAANLLEVLYGLPVFWVMTHEARCDLLVRATACVLNDGAAVDLHEVREGQHALWHAPGIGELCLETLTLNDKIKQKLKSEIGRGAELVFGSPEPGEPDAQSSRLLGLERARAMIKKNIKSTDVCEMDHKGNISVPLPIKAPGEGHLVARRLLGINTGAILLSVEEFGR